MAGSRQGVISVFAALSIGLILSLLFSLLEGARIHGMLALVEPKVQLATQNVLSNYQQELCRLYGILGMDEEYSQVYEQKASGISRCMTEQLVRDTRSDGLLGDLGVDFLRNSDYYTECKGYQLLSDGGGSVYIKQVNRYMVSLFPGQTADDIRTKFSEEYVKEDEEYVELLQTDAVSALTEAEVTDENDITQYVANKSTPATALVLGQTEISKEVLNVRHLPSKRSLQRGNATIESVSTKEFLMSLWYAREKFTNYCSTKKQTGVISYQLEYLICGKMSDKENLEQIIGRLLGIREAIQFARMVQDAGKRQQALALAEAMVGATGNPALVYAVQMGILLAWSFEEARKDVKNLLAGRKISVTGMEGGVNIGYEEYLLLFLTMTGANKTAMRSLDVMENVVNHHLTEGEFYVDRTVTAFYGEVTASMPWLFRGLVTVPVGKLTTVTKTVALKGDYS